MKGKTGLYDLKFKLKVVAAVESGKESAASISAKYGIGGSMTVYRWIAQKNSGKLAGTLNSELTMGKRKLTSEQDSETLKKVLAENEYLKLRLLAMETLIAVTESELGIKLKKNSLGKPSTNSEKDYPK